MEILVDKSIFGVVGWRGGEGAPGACLKQMFGLEKVFICCHPANPTLEVATHILLDL